MVGSDFTIAFRAVGDYDAVIFKSGVTSASYKVFDPSSLTPDNAIYSVNAATAFNTPILELFDTLQVDGYWGNEDSIGYSGRSRLDVSDVAGGEGLEGNKRYRIEIILNTTLWGAVPVVAFPSIVPLSSY